MAEDAISRLSNLPDKSTGLLASPDNPADIRFCSSLPGNSKFCPQSPVTPKPKEKDCPKLPAAPAIKVAPNGEPYTTLASRPLILYAYFESDFGRRNLIFFLDHALHDAADFVFILNGETDADKLIFPDTVDPDKPLRDRSNIRIKRRENQCFDLGAHAEVLDQVVGGPGWFGPQGEIPAVTDLPKEEDATKTNYSPDNKNLKLRYRYPSYILMNASIRGPFMPAWSSTCWSSAYLSKITSKVKLVGMSYNCHSGVGHVQSMIWATDTVGLAVILETGGISECFGNMPAAQNGEVRTTGLLRSKGYEVEVFLSVYHSKDAEARKAKIRALREQEAKKNPTKATGAADGTPAAAAPPVLKSLDSKAMFVPPTGSGLVDSVLGYTGGVLKLEKPGDYWKDCMDEDWLGPGSYFGSFVHPYENLFMKTHRHIEDGVMDHLTEWADGSGYESYDYCF